MFVDVDESRLCHVPLHTSAAHIYTHIQTHSAELDGGIFAIALYVTATKGLLLRGYRAISGMY